MDKELERLNALLAKRDRLRHMLSVIAYDNETACPEGGMEEDGEDIVALSEQIYRIEKSEEFISLVKSLHRRSDFDAFENRLLHNLDLEIRKNEKVSPELRREMDELFQDAYRIWAKAREKNDYAIFAPTLEKIAAISKKVVSLRQDYDPEDPYQSLIDDYEEGFTTEDLDLFFDELEKGILPLLDQIRKADYVPRHDFLSRPVPIHKQEAFSRFLLERNGFDFKRGSLSTTIHPFTSQIGKDDVRVTTHYHEDPFSGAIYLP